MKSSDPPGREHPAAVLRSEIDRTAESHGGLVLVAGEAGIGKTTLVTSVLGHARARGALVLPATCWEHDGSPGYWPWTQVARALRRAVGPERWPGLAEGAGRGLAALLGEEAPRGDGAHGQGDFPLHDAVTNLLLAAAALHPVMVVIDDLHRADAASLRLLEFLVGHAWSERILVVGTYRDADLTVDARAEGVRALFAPLLARARLLPLTGLGADEVATLMERATGRRPEPATADEVWRRTGGNPFFVEQTARLWASGSPVPGMAPGLRWTLDRRLAQLPPALRAFLSAAAVFGREFRAEHPGAALGLAAERADALVALAVSARLLAPGEEGAFRFAHDLIREALYAGLAPPEARRAHAAALRVLRTARDDSLPTELARHAVASGDEVPAAETVALLLAAARDAVGRLALDEAVDHYGRAEARIPEGRRGARARVTLDLAAALNALGDAAGARAAFHEALVLAREAGDHQLLARAALTLHALRDPARHEPLHAEAIREAHEALAGDGGGVRGRPPLDRPALDRLPLDRTARELSLRAVRLARADGDETALGFALLARHDAIWSPATTAERRSLAEELLAVARRGGDAELESQAAVRRLGALLEEGDPRYLAEHRAFVERAERSGLPRDRDEALLSRCAVATLTGRFDEAEELIGRARPGGEQWAFDRASLWRHQRWALLLASGRWGEIDALWESAAGEDAEAADGLIVALTAVQRGDVDRAVRYLGECEAGGARHPEWFAPLWLRFRAQTAAASGDAELCRRVREELAPLGDRWAVSIAGYDVHGPYVLWASVLDAALGRWDAAVAGLTAAWRGAERLGAAPWSVAARLRLADALASRAAPGDAVRGAALRAEARREAEAMGIGGIGGVEAPGERAPSGNVFRPGDGAWTLRFAGRTVHVPDAKGLHDLRRLLARPGADVPALRLLLPEGEGGGPWPSDRAAARRHLGAADERVARALAAGDDGAAAAADRERAALLDELRASHGGAPGDEAERARKAVSGRIRYALRRLDRQHPELARHLSATVTTGAVCSYRPERRVAWTL
ncbi:ATP-binding protein [Streptomyces radicis]|uniref:ATPase n=1 Tax=Streptomyces radicis TaxID=1750517 RepID=A0A3A9WZC1_9ACTN|nr:AAA family ATPase [Streptomyces radicis]RKN11557.1 ATPase [Streptomyces radicis]RKN26425.1 ATPase [Streptomyces radicis]